MTGVTTVTGVTGRAIVQAVTAIAGHHVTVIAGRRATVIAGRRVTVIAGRRVTAAGTTAHPETGTETGTGTTGREIAATRVCM